MTTTTALDPCLEDGTSATTPAGDNLLNDFVKAEGTGYRALAEQAGGRSTVDNELGLSMGDAASPCLFGNVAHVSRPLDAAEATEAIARVRRFYAASSGGPYLLFTPWSLGDLRAEQFQLAGHPPLMARSPRTDRWRSLEGGRDIEGARVIEAATPAEILDFDQTVTEAYPANALLPYGSQPRLFTDEIAASGWKLIDAYLGDQPVATAAAFASDSVVAIEAVSTRPAFRGRGIGALATDAAANTAPNVPAALLASDSGRPVYERLGFLPLMRFTVWVGLR
jgi:GNAT superfamily N-acetyltransferase